MPAVLHHRKGSLPQLMAYLVNVFHPAPGKNKEGQRVCSLREQFCLTGIFLSRYKTAMATRCYRNNMRPFLEAAFDKSGLKNAAM